jgi:hypothetical protein
LAATNNTLNKVSTLFNVDSARFAARADTQSHPMNQRKSYP